MALPLPPSANPNRRTGGSSSFAPTHAGGLALPHDVPFGTNFPNGTRPATVAGRGSLRASGGAFPMPTCKTGLLGLAEKIKFPRMK